MLVPLTYASPVGLRAFMDPIVFEAYSYAPAAVAKTSTGSSSTQCLLSADISRIVRNRTRTADKIALLFYAPPPSARAPLQRIPLSRDLAGTNSWSWQKLMPPPPYHSCSERGRRHRGYPNSNWHERWGRSLSCRWRRCWHPHEQCRCCSISCKGGWPRYGAVLRTPNGSMVAGKARVAT